MIKEESKSEYSRILEFLLEDKNINPPFIIDNSENSYSKDFKIRSKKYIDKIQQLKTSGHITKWLQNNINNIEKLSNGLSEAVDKYLEGQYGQSFDSLESVLENDFVKEQLLKLTFPVSPHFFEDSNSKSLYRVRYSDEYISNKKDMFHIPYNKRNLVSSQRYSMAGVPCLYLGDSLMVCWQEMGRPDLNKLYASHFKLRRNSDETEIMILDIAYSLETLKKQGLEELLVYGDEHKKDELLKSRLALLPLLIACSYDRKFKGANFNVEYVIPSLLLQWTRNKQTKIQGIRYLSTQTTHSNKINIGSNYVFPTTSGDTKNPFFCSSLSKQFLLSNPVSWQILTAIESLINIDLSFNNSENLELELASKYENSKFHSVEQKLMRFARLDSVYN